METLEAMVAYEDKLGWGLASVRGVLG